MKLTPDIISRGYQLLCPTGDRTLSLRDSRISVVANLGAINDDYDSIDFSNNDIIKLDNFPLMPRLKTLIVAGNRVSKIASDISECLPNLTSLVLTNNSISKVSQLEPLFKCKFLERLALLDNHVMAVPHLREYLVYKIPTLKYLNFAKVKAKEREDAVAMFTSDRRTKLFQEMGFEQETNSDLPPAADLNGSAPPAGESRAMEVD